MSDYLEGEGEGEEEKQCRICLETTHTKKNMLITPCKCNGSIKYIHERCLNRWRAINPEQNGTTCNMCLYIYTYSPTLIFESIPDLTPFIFIIDHSVMTYITITYVSSVYSYVIYLNYYFTYNIIYVVQFAYQITMITLLLLHCRAKNLYLYGMGWKQKSRWILPMVHIVGISHLCISESFSIFTFLLINLCVGKYWTVHKSILDEINIYKTAELDY